MRVRSAVAQGGIRPRAEVTTEEVQDEYIDGKRVRQTRISDHMPATKQGASTSKDGQFKPSYARSLSTAGPSISNGQTAQKTLAPPRPTTPVRTTSAFAMLESPSTPVRDRAASPGINGKASDTSRTNSSAGLKTPSGSNFSLALGPSPEIVTTPTEAHHPGKSNKMVAAEVKGIGRVALARDFLFDKLGASTAEQAIAAANAAVPASNLAQPFQLTEPKTLDIFANPPSSASLDKPKLADQRTEALDKMRSWLESPENSENETAEEPLPAPLPEAPVEQDEYPVAQSPGHFPGVIVGGKTVRVLLQSKKRQADQEHEEAAQIVEKPVESSSSLSASSRPQRQVRSLYGKGKAAANSNDDHCYCSRGDDGEPMISCDICQTWYHLDCVDLTPRKTPRRWVCFRCNNSTPPLAASGKKRPRLSSSNPETPTMSHEPVLVETVMSPRTRDNFYKGAVEHVVLAPSPQSSPVRRFAPRSPLPPYTTPATPQPGFYSRADYSPRSPLSHRVSRSRMNTGTYDEPGQPWSAAWEAQDGEHGDSDHPLFPPVDEIGYHASNAWHDLNMTPSRSMPTNFGYSEQFGGLHTPMSNSKRYRVLSNNGNPFSTSQEFLTNLHNNGPAHDEASWHQQVQHERRRGGRLPPPVPSSHHHDHPHNGVSPLLAKRAIDHRRTASWGRQDAFLPPTPQSRASMTSSSPVFDQGSPQFAPSHTHYHPYHHQQQQQQAHYRHPSRLSQETYVSHAVASAQHSSRQPGHSQQGQKPAVPSAGAQDAQRPSSSSSASSMSGTGRRSSGHDRTPYFD